VPKENVLGEPGKGYKISIETLNEGRIGIGAQMIGIATGALESALRLHRGADNSSANRSTVSGSSVSAGRDGNRTSSRTFNGLQRCSHEDAGVNFVKKRRCEVCTRRAWPSGSVEAIELYGGYGYVNDYPSRKYWRDSKIGAIYEGTSEYAVADDCQINYRKVSRAAKRHKRHKNRIFFAT
jgi:hypothetical protein